MVFVPDGTWACTCEGDPTSLIFPSSIHTAAGESTFPVRGSSKRPALTKVVWAASCPAPKLSAANRNRIRVRFMRVFLLKLFEPKRRRLSDERVAERGLFMTKGDHRVDAQRAAGGKVAGEKSDSDEQEGYGPKS